MNGKNKNIFKNKKYLVSILICVAFILFLVIGVGQEMYYESTKVTYELELDTHTSTFTDTIEAVEAKEAVYAENKPVSVFVGDENIDDNNDGKPDKPGVYIGTDISVGTYEITSLELDDYCSLKLKQASSDNMFDGDQYYQGDTIYLIEGYKLAAFNCGTHNGGLNVTLTPVGEGELLEEAIEATPEQKITYTFSALKYDDDTLLNKRCSITNDVFPEKNLDHTDIDCLNVDHFVEFRNKVFSKSTESTKSNSYTVIDKKDRYSCYIDDSEYSCSSNEVFEYMINEMK